MSAPHEVFVVCVGTQHQTPQQARKESGPRLGNSIEVRYLRADLVCGECAKIDDEYPCECRGCLTTDDYDRPACMAFVPREVAK